MDTNSEVSTKPLLLLFIVIPIMVTILVLSSVFVGYYVSSHSRVATPIQIMPATADVHINNPEPKVTITMPNMIPPKVEVNIPPSQPTVNVSTPPAIVTMVRASDSYQEKKEKIEAPKPEAPKPEEPKPEEPKPEEPVKVNSVEPPTNIINENTTIDDLYRAAEKYLEAYCLKKGLNPKKESERWYFNWKSRLKQAQHDSIDTDEQSFINRMVVDNSDYFDKDNATPEKIVEGCRILLRYRDGNLKLYSKLNNKLMKDDNLKKALTFLVAGPEEKP
jgi:hypothetical protein